MSPPSPPNLPLVLLVDDHADTVGLMSRLLRGEGFAVLKADSVAAALAAHDGRPIDLLVSDLSLPDGTGLDVMRQLRQTNPGLRGIAVSGRDSADDRRASHAAGFTLHLTKPVDIRHLANACRELLGRQ